MNHALGNDGGDALRGLLEGWLAKARSQRDAHAQASDRMRRLHRLIGTAAICLPLLVPFALVAQSEGSLSIGALLAVGALSVGAAALAACLAFLRPSDRAEAHNRARSEYDGLIERAELLSAIHKSGPLDEVGLGKLREACTEVQAQMASVATKSPDVSGKPAPKARASKKAGGAPAKAAPAPAKAETAPAATSAFPQFEPPPPFPASFSAPPAGAVDDELTIVGTSRPPPVEAWNLPDAEGANPTLDSDSEQTIAGTATRR